MDEIFLHLKEDGTECGYTALGDPPAVCTKCGWTPLRQERDDLRKENEALRRGIKDVGFETLQGEFIRRDGSISPLMVVPRDAKKIVHELSLVIFSKEL